MRRRTLLAASTAIAAYLCSAPSLADDDPNFKGPGWYLLDDAFVGWFIDSGPYSSEEDCLARKSAEVARTGDTSGYDCRYLRSASDLDQ
jgi:hypothetical protein